jgi:glucose-6-phosphate isomerase
MMHYTQNIDGCFGSAPRLSHDFYQSLLGQARESIKKIVHQIDSGDLPAFSIVNNTDDLPELTHVAQRFKAMKHVLVLGTGGSSLGGQTLHQLVSLGFAPTTPAIHYLDNIDPTTFDELLPALKWQHTGLIIISKSGETAETLMQMLCLMRHIEEHHPSFDWSAQVVVITEPKLSTLYTLSEKKNIPIIAHHPKIGGRFSVFSNVGALPALIAGVDMSLIRQGAADVLNALRTQQELAPPVLGAVITTGLYQQSHIHTCVTMPYLDRLSAFAFWYRQLWAESLGKDGKGITPARAMGTVDQHSQLQLYLDGPADKMFTIIHGHTERQGLRSSDITSEEPRLAYLHAHTMGSLLAAECLATITTLIEHHRPVRVIQINQLTALELGALLMHFMLETIITADLMGVDAFNQPAVEQGKILTKVYMSEHFKD